MEVPVNAVEITEDAEVNINPSADLGNFDWLRTARMNNKEAEEVHNTQMYYHIEEIERTEEQ